MPKNEIPQHALTTKQAARHLGVSESLLEKLRVYTPKKSPPFIRIGRAIRYRPADLDVWASAQSASRE